MARRKKVRKPTREIVSEYDGWKTGDNCYTVFTGESKPSYCEILEFHPGDSVTPSVAVTEVTTGKYRVQAMMAIAETGKEAKKIAPAWSKWLADWKAKQAAIEKKRKIEILKAEKAALAKEEEARKAEELEAQEAATRELKKKKSRVKKK